MFGAIEAGGTKFICGIGTSPEDLITVQIPTATPESTIPEVINFFKKSAQPIRAVGIGSFGPVDLRPESPTFGFITSTPKPGWCSYDLAGAISSSLGVPVGFDTDVNAAALGEARWGAAEGLQDFIYLTVGTGIGGGAVVNGELLHGLVHPEMGHIRIPHDCDADPFPGVCPFHGDCLEGLASGPAMQARWGIPPDRLPEDHPAWALEARYLALGLVAYTCILSPRRIIIGGGVMQYPGLLDLVRGELLHLLNGYIQCRELTDNIHNYVVKPGLGWRAGILGALVLAERALHQARSQKNLTRQK